MMPIAFASPFLCVTSLLLFGCAAVRLFPGRPAAATRVQRVTLVTVFFALILFAIVASFPVAQRPLLPIPRPVVTATPDPVPAVPLPLPETITPSISPQVEVAPPPDAPRPLSLPSSETVLWGLLGVWAVGTFLCLVHLLQGHVTLRRLHAYSASVEDSTLRQEIEQAARSAGVRCPDLRYHPMGAGPLLAGVRCPTLYVPPVLPEDRALRSMLWAHEMAHLSRRDIRYLHLSRALCAVLWWHPLARLLARQMEQTAEEACDACAIRGHRPEAMPDYTRFLLNAVRPSTSALTQLTSGMTSPRSNIGRRIQRLLARKGDEKPITAGLRIGTVIAATSVALVGIIVQSSLSAPPSATAPARPDEERGSVPTAAEFRQEYATSGNTTGTTSPGLQVMEFSDFECPACRRANQPTPWRTAYPYVQVQFRHLPLEQHPHAMQAALQAQKHALKGHFWKAHDELFAGKDLQTQMYILVQEEKRAFVEAVKIASRKRPLFVQKQPDVQSEKQKFIEAVKLANEIHKVTDPDKHKQVYIDLALARRWKVSATPTYFVLNWADNSVHRFVGNRALRAYCDGNKAQARANSSRTQYLQKAGRPVTLRLRNVTVAEVVKELFQQENLSYQVAPGLDLGTARMNFTVTGGFFWDVLNEVQQSSPIAFGIRQEEEAAEYTVTLTPIPAHGSLMGRVVFDPVNNAEARQPDRAEFEVIAEVADEDLFRTTQDPVHESPLNPEAQAVRASRASIAPDGTFTLKNLGRFRYNIGVRQTTYAPGSRGQEWVTPLRYRVRPQVGATQNLGTLRLTPGGVVQGQVTDKAGKPRANLMIGSCGPDTRNTSAAFVNVDTDAHGKYVFHLPPGRSYVYIASDGFDHAQTNITLAEGETRTVNLRAIQNK